MYNKGTFFRDQAHSEGECAGGSFDENDLSQHSCTELQSQSGSVDGYPNSFNEMLDSRSRKTTGKLATDCLYEKQQMVQKNNHSNCKSSHQKSSNRNLISFFNYAFSEKDRARINNDLPIFRQTLDALDDNKLIQLVIIDSAIKEIDAIVNSVTRTTVEIFVLETGEDSVRQISNFLVTYRRKIDALHLFSFGDNENIQFGNDVLALDNLSKYEFDLRCWANSMKDDADIFFYGSDIAGSDSGILLLKQMASIIGGNIAAPSNRGERISGEGYSNKHKYDGLFSEDKQRNRHVNTNSIVADIEKKKVNIRHKETGDTKVNEENEKFDNIRDIAEYKKNRTSNIVRSAYDSSVKMVDKIISLVGIRSHHTKTMEDVDQHELDNGRMVDSFASDTVEQTEMSADTESNEDVHFDKVRNSANGLTRDALLSNDAYPSMKEISNQLAYSLQDNKAEVIDLTSRIKQQEHIISNPTNRDNCKQSKEKQQANTTPKNNTDKSRKPSQSIERQIKLVDKFNVDVKKLSDVNNEKDGSGN